jgi:hypothetical protein
MSEDFLSRWSRLKRQGGAQEDDRSSAAAASDSPADPPVSEGRTEKLPASPEPPSVDLSTLPPIESIGADTDIRAFLRPGVPVELTRGALRRAWSADPAIRDFVGLAENAWDFNVPASVPGFGPALPPDTARRLLAEALGQTPAEAATAQQTPAQRWSESEGGNMLQYWNNSSEELPRSPEDACGTHRANVAADNIAAHNEVFDREGKADPKATAGEPPRRARRRHGGALPQ